MAFQTNILRDGEWVTETVNLQAALEASATPKAAARTHPDPPRCGILSRTIVESPIVQWILPVRLRSKAQNDIAFIGDHFVQISELREDGQVHEVVRKSDFGCRIRGAIVLGNSLQHGLVDDDLASNVKTKDEDTLMRDSAEATDPLYPRSLPPQFLVLMLESGDTIYVFLHQKQDLSLEFILNRHKSPRNLTYFGFHLSVDPSSRYMAAASPDGVLVMYEMESMRHMNEQYRMRGSFEPVKSIRIRAIQGVLHKLEFLYPRPEDDYHIILLLIVTRKERSSAEPVTRLVTYEWEVGDNLKEVLSEEKTGHRLPMDHRMPTMIIPLRFNTSFFVVSQPDIIVVKNCLSGVPRFEALDTYPPEKTSMHHGASEKPLWTAWSRPFRRKKYFEKTDIIYIAREDGAIIHVEIDVPELVPSVTNVGCLDTNINTAFTTAYDVFTDVLIIGGDSGPGGIWKLAPRTDLEQVSVLPNWSPVVDIATSSWRSFRNSTLEHRGLTSRDLETNRFLAKPDSLFSASGRGLKGNLTQWRWGIQGRIGLDIESGEPVRRSWGFSIDGPSGRGLYGLLALPNSSIVLNFSGDFSQVDSLGPDSTGFDLAFRTLYACQTKSGLIIQTTESSISLMSGSQLARHSLESVLGIAGISAENAFYTNDLLVLSTYNKSSSQIYIIRIEGMAVSLVSDWGIAGEVTCVSLFKMADNSFVIVCSLVGRTSWISVYSLEGKPIVNEAFDKMQVGEYAREMESNSSAFEPLTSICVVREGTEASDFVAGTRCGHLLNIRISDTAVNPVSWNAEVMGVAPVDVSPAHGQFDGNVAAVVCCDNNLIMMSKFSEQTLKFQTKNFIWLTDSNDSSLPSPSVHSAFSIGHSLSGYAGHMSLMLLSGSRLLLADIWPHYALVPRCLRTDGTPTRIIFSHTWNCLVVALLQDDKPTLLFIDPDTGMHIADASDKDKNPSEFISGLGHSGDRIYGLCEWLYVKDGKTFAFILVATKDGRLLIVSVNKLESQKGVATGRRLQYWTRYKKVFDSPVYSVVGDDEGIIFCVERTIHWDVLDLAEKRLRQMNQYELDSPATSLQVSNGKILALTALHSLEVIDHRSGESGDMALVHTDRISRATIHMADIGADSRDSVDSPWPVTMLSDHRGGLAGVWVPWGHQNKEFEIVFEGSLPTSVRRFAQAKTWPLWLDSGTRDRYGAIASTNNGCELFGVSLDGSLRHFTLINYELWRFLKLLQNLAQRSSSLNPLAVGSLDSDNMDWDDVEIEPRLHPKLMHINGDLLGLCFGNRLLEKLVRKNDKLKVFREYLDGLEGGRWTDSFRDNICHSEEDRQDAYFKLGYDVLDYLLTPVL
ncbi:hypothetical protein QQS21_004067 [Conoideocrella luteorostrata]|uniref:RSE1/DDB1/CPSF1 first beta-propeller domain-containing protein n=1 Tax=Conoideocrella luteorostrata TaxID=1105319 RepID=A0AAJ0CV11_9HYPO|nr:hypothetical protein QQS21_004067 [Conoideocrella luteorostrata]